MSRVTRRGRQESQRRSYAVAHEPAPDSTRSVITPSLQRRDFLRIARNALLLGTLPAAFLSSACGSSPSAPRYAPDCALDAVLECGETLSSAALETVGGTADEAYARLLRLIEPTTDSGRSLDEVDSILKVQISDEWDAGAVAVLDGWLFTPTELDLAAAFASPLDTCSSI